MACCIPVILVETVTEGMACCIPVILVETVTEGMACCIPVILVETVTVICFVKQQGQLFQEILFESLLCY